MRGRQRQVVPLRLPAYQPIPAPDRGTDLIEVLAAQLQPTQWCVGLAEIWSREKDFAQDTRQQRLDYLRGKPVPLIRSADGAMWMLDRHHRLRGLIGIDPGATTWAYVVQELPTADRSAVLAYLHNHGWLYLYDGRGNGPRPAEQLPTSLLGLDDDPYRSLVWKLKQEGWIKPQPLIPYHELRWGAWLRSRPLPPFSSRRLEPALAAARPLVCSSAAQDLLGGGSPLVGAGWGVCGLLGPGAEGGQGPAAQPGTPTKLVIRDQGLRLDPPLLLQLPHEAHVGIVVQSQQARGQLLGRAGAVASSVVEVEPALVVQIGQHGASVGGWQLLNHVTPGGGPWINADEASQAVVPVQHPHGAIGRSDQRDRFAAQVVKTLLTGVLGEILLARPDLRQSHTPLGRLQLRR